MQRIISLQTSRNADRDSTEFVTKRLCCSFLFSVAFLSLLGGFLLGRYATDRAIILKNVSLQVKQQVEEKHSVEIMYNISKLVHSINSLTPKTHIADYGVFAKVVRCANDTTITTDEDDLSINTALKTSKILSSHLDHLHTCFETIEIYLEKLLKTTKEDHQNVNDQNE